MVTFCGFGGTKTNLIDPAANEARQRLSCRPMPDYIEILSLYCWPPLARRTQCQFNL